MSHYVCLLLDSDCKVMEARVLNAEHDAAATVAAVELAQKARTWGYELWCKGRQVVALYDCEHPPARIAMP
jgi:hypothetical protein